ncbi:MAG: family 20 glycosylhydrolase [Spirochaetaceae bacterium]|jgi:hexosaminidase|nr:family 20 glycosylhydrolase [Spirochaetaceae bacterium]
MIKGLMIDSARHFWTIDDVLKIIAQAAISGINTLHWHLTDDQGWRIESKTFPKLHSTDYSAQCNGEFYSQDSIREIINYAAQLHIEIIPEIEIPGHSHALLTAYPELGCSDDARAIICPGKESTFTFLEELFAEMCSIFPGKYFHIGGDEAPKGGWRKCSHCRKKLAEIADENSAYDKNDYELLQGYMANRVHALLKKQGKQTICWNDALAAKNLDTDIIIQYWTAQYADLMKPFAEKGGRFIMSDMFHLYLDYPYSMTPLKKVFDYKPIIKGHDFSNYPGFLGIEACRWGGEPLPQMMDTLFPRLDALFSTASDYNTFTDSLKKRYRDAENEGLHFHPLDKCDPEGEERQKETFAFMINMNAKMNQDAIQHMENSPAQNKDFVESFIKYFFEPSDMEWLEGFMKKIGYSNAVSK